MPDTIQAPKVSFVERHHLWLAATVAVLGTAISGGRLVLQPEVTTPLIIASIKGGAVSVFGAVMIVLWVHTTRRWRLLQDRCQQTHEACEQEQDYAVQAVRYLRTSQKANEIDDTELDNLWFTMPSARVTGAYGDNPIPMTPAQISSLLARAAFQAENLIEIADVLLMIAEANPPFVHGDGSDPTRRQQFNEWLGTEVARTVYIWLGSNQHIFITIKEKNCFMDIMFFAPYKNTFIRELENRLREDEADDGSYKKRVAAIRFLTSLINLPIAGR